MMFTKMPIFIFAFVCLGYFSGVNGVAVCPASTQYVCDDGLDTDTVCMVIFSGSNPNNGTIDPKCSNTTYATTAQSCAYTCGACCQTPAYSCQNAPQPNPFNCAVLTKDQCGQAAAQAQLAQYCPATCGLCQVGGCVDAIDCTGLASGCADPSLKSFYSQNCAKSCGLCGSTGTPSGPAPAPAPVPSSACADTNVNCPTWATNGFCASTFYTSAQIQQYCAKTCNRCAGK